MREVAVVSGGVVREIPAPGTLSPRAHSDRGFWLRFTFACATGELIGFGAAAATWIAVVTTVGEPRSLLGRAGFLLLMTLAGVAEGAIFSSFQAHVLKERVPSLSRPIFIALTAAIAGLGWLLGMLPTALVFHDGAPAPAPELSLFGTVIVAAIFGLVVGSVFGGAQALALRPAVATTKPWIVGNAIAWTAALPVTFLVAALPLAGMSPAALVALGVLGGAVAGLLVGAVTGFFALQLVPREVIMTR